MARRFYDAVSPGLEELALAVESQIETSPVLRLHLGVPQCSAASACSRACWNCASCTLGCISTSIPAQFGERVGDTLDAAIILSRDPDLRSCRPARP